MLKSIKELFEILSASQKRRFFQLQVLVVLMALFEILGVASIAPFMALVADMSLVDGDGVISKLYVYSGMSKPKEFAFWLGVSVLLALSISAIISMFTTWRLSLFATQTGTEIADSLYKHYMTQKWLFHASGSSAQLTKKIANEAQRTTGQILLPLVQMNARLVLAMGMSAALFIYNPMVAIVGLCVFFVAYIVLFKVVRKRLHNNGRSISKTLAFRYRLMNEGFGGIKDTLILGRNIDYISRFKLSGEAYAYAQGTKTALSQVPRYFMELIAFGSIISLVLYLFKFYEGDLGSILPVLSVYALAGFKLLPAFQQMYVSIAQVRGNLSAFDSIKEDLYDAKIKEKVSLRLSSSSELDFKNSIALSNINFKYPSKSYNALKDLSVNIKVNSVIGFVGPSGSGKSTAIDVLLGLIEADSGRLLVDGVEINLYNKRAWQDKIGLVPQAIFLSEGSIAENIAFGVPKDEISTESVLHAIELAHLTEFIDSLEDGIYTTVGERGVQLSGGQRQRIGIARALYHNPSVLVFDEATSALDGITEKIIMEAIHDFHGSKTVIMIAHRLKTVEKCDLIYFLVDGRIEDQGTYAELIANNSQFRKMTQYA